MISWIKKKKFGQRPFWIIALGWLALHIIGIPLLIPLLSPDNVLLVAVIVSFGFYEFLEKELPGGKKRPAPLHFIYVWGTGLLVYLVVYSVMWLFLWPVCRSFFIYEWEMRFVTKELTYGMQLCYRDGPVGSTLFGFWLINSLLSPILYLIYYFFRWLFRIVGKLWG